MECKRKELMLMAGLAISLCACAGQARDERQAVYTADLLPLNTGATGRPASGTATLSVEGDELLIVVDAEGLAPGVAHLQHFHGFIIGKDANCAGAPADANRDGIIDLLETEPVSGITLVPFHGDPASLQIKADTYPKASGPAGRISYRQRVLLEALAAALQRNYGVDELALDKRVVYLHGVDPAALLPVTVQSLPGVDPHVTLPVACGPLVRTR